MACRRWQETGPSPVVIPPGAGPQCVVLEDMCPARPGDLSRLQDLELVTRWETGRHEAALGCFERRLPPGQQPSKASEACLLGACGAPPPADALRLVLCVSGFLRVRVRVRVRLLLGAGKGLLELSVGRVARGPCSCLPLTPGNLCDEWGWAGPGLARAQMTQA